MAEIVPLTKHNENTTAYITATFKDKNGDQAAPVSARYRVDNVSNASAVVAWTAIASPTAVEEIVITALENAIVTPANPEEVIEVTVEGTYSASDKVTEKHRYTLVNLSYFP